jgi:hypothetical protein
MTRIGVSVCHNNAIEVFARQRAPALGQTMRRLNCLVSVLALVSASLFAEDEKTVPAIGLADLAAKADVIVLAQVKDTDYFYRHEYPVNGNAYLKVLIPYKTDKAMDIMEIYESGLHENECYFPNPSVFEEGRRYLVFLQLDPEKPDRYRGLAEGCALDVLVDSDNHYALRYPVTGIDLTDSLTDLATDMQFSDSYALENENSLNSTELNILLEAGLITPFEGTKKSAPVALGAPPTVPAGRQWIYTRGIDLVTIRKMLGPESLSIDRNQKRVE